MVIEVVDNRLKGYITTAEASKKYGLTICTILKRCKELGIETIRIGSGKRGTIWIPENVVITKKQRTTSPMGLGKAKFKEDYPFNFVHKVFGDDFVWDGTNDQIAGLDYVLNQFTERQRNCVIDRFVNKLIYDKMADKYGISRMRISQILENIYRKVKNPVRANYILNGLDGEKKRLAMERDKNNREYDPDKKIDEYGYSEAFYTLNLSVRASNCLRRARIQTVSGIVENIRNENIIKIRNLGVKGLGEIEKEVEQYYGLPIDDILKGKERM